MTFGRRPGAALGASGSERIAVTAVRRTIARAAVGGRRHPPGHHVPDARLHRARRLSARAGGLAVAGVRGGARTDLRRPSAPQRLVGRRRDPGVRSRPRRDRRRHRSRSRGPGRTRRAGDGHHRDRLRDPAAGGGRPGRTSPPRRGDGRHDRREQHRLLRLGGRDAAPQSRERRDGGPGRDPTARARRERRRGREARMHDLADVRPSRARRRGGRPGAHGSGDAPGRRRPTARSAR